MEAYTTFCFQMAVSRPSMAAVANTCADVMLQLQRELEARADPFEPTAGCARCASGCMHTGPGVRAGLPSAAATVVTVCF
jgi:hypothetical protein